MTKTLILAAVAACLALGMRAQEIPVRNFMLYGGAGEKQDVLPLDRKTSGIKFGSDSVRVGERSIAAAGFSIDSFLEECRSRLSFAVTADSLDVFLPAGGLYVALSGDGLSYMGLVEKTDSMGTVTFPDIPYGEYTARVFDDSKFFKVKEENLFHRYEDTVDVAMEEDVLLPAALKWETDTLGGGLYALEMHWLMGADRLYGPFHDYLFTVYLNGEWHGETSETNYRIEDLLPGEYRIAVNSLSAWGHESDGCYELSLELEPHATTGIGAISDGCEDGDAGEDSGYTYFDLSGRSLGNGPLPSGIYIRRHSSGRTEKVLIP